MEQIIIKKDHPKFKVIDEMCFHSKNLYNEANYTIRQEFIETGEYIPYKKMNFDFKTHENYKLCMSQPANCVLRVLDKNWKSYFVAIKDWKQHPEKYLGMPKLPKYLPKDGRFNWMIPNNTCYYEQEKGEIYFQIRKLHLTLKLTLLSGGCTRLNGNVQHQGKIDAKYVPRVTHRIMLFSFLFQ